MVPAYCVTSLMNCMPSLSTPFCRNAVCYQEFVRTASLWIRCWDKRGEWVVPDPALMLKPVASLCSCYCSCYCYCVLACFSRLSVIPMMLIMRTAGMDLPTEWFPGVNRACPENGPILQKLMCKMYKCMHLCLQKKGTIRTHSRTRKRPNRHPSSLP